MRWIGKCIGKKQALFFTFLFAFFTAFVLPWVSGYTSREIGVDASPDMLLLYGREEFYSILESYGQSGRNFYVMMRWTFDLVWPLVYGLFLLSTIGYFSRNFRTSYKWLYITFPLLAVLFDYMENILATIHMLSYPTRVLFLVPVLSTISLLKWGMLGLAFLCLFVLLLQQVYLFFKKKDRQMRKENDV